MPLSSTDYRIHPEAVKYISRYHKHREELGQRLFKLFNEEAFMSSLDPQTPLEWKPRLTKTAGLCTQTGKFNTKTKVYSERKCSIKLSDKVTSEGEEKLDLFFLYENEFPCRC